MAVFDRNLTASLTPELPSILGRAVFREHSQNIRNARRAYRRFAEQAIDDPPASPLEVHPVEEYCGLKECGHADPICCFCKDFRQEKAACPNP